MRLAFFIFYIVIKCAICTSLKTQTRLFVPESSVLSLSKLFCSEWIGQFIFIVMIYNAQTSHQGHFSFLETLPCINCLVVFLLKELTSTCTLWFILFKVTNFICIWRCSTRYTKLQYEIHKDKCVGYIWHELCVVLCHAFFNFVAIIF